MNAAELSALRMSLLVALGATAIVLPLGTALGQVLARRQFRGKALLEAVIFLPLVLPPVVTGYFLLVALGAESLAGRAVRDWFGWEIVFTPAGMILAAAVVGLPLMVQSARVALEGVDPGLVDAARTLGHGRWSAFVRVTLPLSRRGILAGALLAFARALGEFGATVMVAANIPGQRTLALEIYRQAVVPGGEAAVLRLAVISIALSLAALLATEFFPHKAAVMIALNVSIRRGDFSLDAALDSQAEAVGLYGPSGCGKTTLLHALAGLLRPHRGRIAVGDRILFDADTGINLPPEQRGVGIVFQDVRLFPHRSVRENLRFARPRAGSPDAETGPAFDDVVDLLDLTALLERRPATLSGGEARRVAVGRALLGSPRILVLDEPLTGLDPERAAVVMAYLLRLRRELSLPLLYVSHRYTELLTLTDHVAVLGNGGVLASGKPEAVLDTAITGETGALETTLHGSVRLTDRGEPVVHCQGVDIHAPLAGANPGDSVYVTVGAREVILAVDAPPRTSARNTIAGRVAGVHRSRDAVYVEVDAGPRLWAEVTERSLVALGLEVGSPVTALIKARAVRAVRLG